MRKKKMGEKLKLKKEKRKERTTKRIDR